MNENLVRCECVECPCTHYADENDRVMDEELLCDDCAMDDHNDDN